MDSSNLTHQKEAVAVVVVVEAVVVEVVVVAAIAVVVTAVVEVVAAIAAASVRLAPDNPDTIGYQPRRDSSTDPVFRCIVVVGKIVVVGILLTF